jgi:AcrR family transcriptional regulator
VSRAPRRAAPRRARGERVDEILDAARQVFCDKGFEAAAVAEIAARIGVVEGTVYKYFETKRALLVAVLERWYEDMFGDYARELAAVAGARPRLRLLIWRHLRSVREHPALCRLMFREVRSEADYPGSPLHAMNRRYTGFLTGVLEAGVAAGEFRADLPVSLLRDLVYGGIEHHAWNWLCGRGTLDIDRVAADLDRVLCEGIEPRPAAADLGRETARLSRLVNRMERGLRERRSA